MTCLSGTSPSAVRPADQAAGRPDIPLICEDVAAVVVAAGIARINLDDLTIHHRKFGPVAAAGIGVLKVNATDLDAGHEVVVVHIGFVRIVLELREEKSAIPAPPETWGLEPLVSTRRGGYGMGLFHARRILAGHDGTVTFAFDPAAQLLTTRITLPLAGS